MDGSRVMRKVVVACEAADLVFVFHASCHAFVDAVEDHVERRVLPGALVGKNIGVIEFEVANDGCARTGVDKFAALVEKRRVVFIGSPRLGISWMTGILRVITLLTTYKSALNLVGCCVSKLS